MPEARTITSSHDFYIGGIRFDAGTYSIKLIADARPWQCDYCDEKLPTKDAPCPVHGAPGPAGWCPF